MMLYHADNQVADMGQAFLWAAADAAGVVVSAIVISLTGWSVLDPVVAILVSGVIACSAFRLAKSAIHLSLDGVPDEADRTAIDRWLRTLTGVTICMIFTSGRSALVHRADGASRNAQCMSERNRPIKF